MTPEYEWTYAEAQHYDTAGVRVMLDAALLLYKRTGQRRVKKTAQFQRVLALRQCMQDRGAWIK